MTVANQVPVKQRLLEDIRAHSDGRGRCMLKFEGLAKRHGLNGHDAAKNLDQLRKEGLIRFSWGEGSKIERIRLNPGGANQALIDQSQKAPSEKLAEAISRMPWQPNGWRAWDTAELRRLSGLTIAQISTATKALREDGRLQQLGGGGQGLRIQGVRWRGERAPEQAIAPVAEESANGDAKSPSGASQEAKDRHAQALLVARQQLGAAAASPPTPELDRYIAAKQLASQAPADNPFISVEFTPIPIAEEAIMLKRRLEGTG